MTLRTNLDRFGVLWLKSDLLLKNSKSKIQHTRDLLRICKGIYIEKIMKNRKIHLTRPKIDKIIFCKKETLRNGLSELFRKKNFWKIQFFSEKIEFSGFSEKSWKKSWFFMKNRKIHLTRPKIEKIIFCKKEMLKKYISKQLLFTENDFIDFWPS